MARRNYLQQNQRAAATQKYGTSAPDQRPFESDADYLKRLGKMADQRMKRLEQLSTQPGYENVLKWAYATAKSDLKSLGSNNWESVARRTKKGEYDKKNMQRRINAVKRFLESPTSMKKTIDKQYGGVASQINEKYGLDLSWSDVGKFFDSEAWKKISEDYGSQTAVKAIGVIRRLDLSSVGDVKEAITNAASSTQYLDDDEVMHAVSKLLRKNGVHKQRINQLKGI